MFAMDQTKTQSAEIFTAGQAPPDVKPLARRAASGGGADA